METIGNCVRVSTRQSLKKEENEEIYGGLLKSLLLLRTVVPAVCSMGARALPTVQMLSEIAKQMRRAGEVNRETPRNKDIKAQEHDQGIRERGGWRSSRRERRGSSLRVRGCVWLTKIAHGVEI